MISHDASTKLHYQRTVSFFALQNREQRKNTVPKSTGFDIPTKQLMNHMGVGKEHWREKRGREELVSLLKAALAEAFTVILDTDIADDGKIYLKIEDLRVLPAQADINPNDKAQCQEQTMHDSNLMCCYSRSEQSKPLKGNNNLLSNDLWLINEECLLQPSWFKDDTEVPCTTMASCSQFTLICEHNGSYRPTLRDSSYAWEASHLHWPSPSAPHLLHSVHCWDKRCESETPERTHQGDPARLVN